MSAHERAARPSSARAGERGQMVVLFALCLFVLIAFAGLLVDGGMAWSNRRKAQSAADTAALAAAKAYISGGAAQTTAAGIAATNGYPQNYVDCQGNARTDGVIVNRPPSSGPHSLANDPTGANDYVEVITSGPMHTTFAGAIGQGCWMVSARAVATVGTASVAKCSFCSLNRSSDNHTLILKNGAALRVDGDIYVNSSNGGYTPGSCGKLKDWHVCGDGFDIFGDGGSISAQTISVHGGWETHDNNPTYADGLATGCVDHPQPPAQGPPANVCIHMPQIADPLNDPLTPKNVITPPTLGTAPVAGANGCPSGAIIPTGSLLTISTGGAVICPGTYFGGIRVASGGSVTMQPGVYFIAGGGFTVTGTGAVNGTSGVMIYNSSGSGSPTNTNPGVDLVPAADPLKKTPTLGKNDLVSSPAKNANIAQSVAITFEVERPKASDPLPAGTMSFYDGQNTIAGCVDKPVVAGSNGNARKAVCTTSWATAGTKSVSAIYHGGPTDPVYNGIGDTLTLTINVPAGAAIAPVNISTTGAVKIYGPSSGPYRGLTIFQDRSSNLTVTLNPGAGSAPACGGSFMTIGVPNGIAPAPCGAMGGLQGTVYAGNEEALVFVTASGLSNLQVISGRIQVDSDADARFAFTPQFFANGAIRLTE
jgi:putative Flp pilus-assembly TadE/G-like protein